jgi:hypothetical protein
MVGRVWDASLLASREINTLWSLRLGGQRIFLAVVRAVAQG